MKFLTELCALAKYFPWIALSAIYIKSLWRSITALSNDPEQIIQILTNSLNLGIVIVILLWWLALDCWNQLICGKKIDIIGDFIEQNSKKFSITSNRVFVGSALCMIMAILNVLYGYTNNRIFRNLGIALSALFLLDTIINIFALYIREKSKTAKSFSSKYINPIVLPILICLILLLITKINTVRFVYKNIIEPRGTFTLIAILIAILCYVLAITYCYFSCIYCLIGCSFSISNINQLEAKIKDLQNLNEERKNSLRQAIDYVDNTSKGSGLINNCLLGLLFISSNLKSYFKETYYNSLYILLFSWLKLVRRFSKLMEPEQIGKNTIQFCEIVIVLELLSLDMVLFINLGSDNTCSRFFELLSTVIIIPILLTSLTNLKLTNESNP